LSQINSKEIGVHQNGAYLITTVASSTSGGPILHSLVSWHPSIHNPRMFQLASFLRLGGRRSSIPQGRCAFPVDSIRSAAVRWHKRRFVGERALPCQTASGLRFRSWRMRYSCVIGVQNEWLPWLPGPGAVCVRRYPPAYRERLL